MALFAWSYVYGVFTRCDRRSDGSRDRSLRPIAPPIAATIACTFTRCGRRGDRSRDRSPRRSPRVNTVLAVSVEHWLVADRQTQNDSYNIRASMASRGKTNIVLQRVRWGLFEAGENIKTNLTGLQWCRFLRCGRQTTCEQLSCSSESTSASRRPRSV